MITVHYEFEFPYDQDRGRPAPMVVCWVSGPETPRRGVFTKLLLDTGAEVSLFEGSLAGALGIDLSSGRERQVVGLGDRLQCHQHTVVIENDVLGTFQLDACFGPAGVRISTPVLGRDFFRLAKFGFDERREVFQFAKYP